MNFTHTLWGNSKPFAYRPQGRTWGRSNTSNNRVEVTRTSRAPYPGRWGLDTFSSTTQGSCTCAAAPLQVNPFQKHCKIPGSYLLSPRLAERKLKPARLDPLVPGRPVPRPRQSEIPIQNPHPVPPQVGSQNTNRCPENGFHPMICSVIIESPSKDRRMSHGCVDKNTPITAEKLSIPPPTPPPPFARSLRPPHHLAVCEPVIQAQVAEGMPHAALTRKAGRFEAYQSPAFQIVLTGRSQTTRRGERY